MAKQDTYQKVTDAIIEALENAEAGNWQMPWVAQSNLPFNGSSKKEYNGINVLLLWASQMKQGFTSTEWFTYKQAQKAGGQVRRGEKGTQVVFWKFFTPSGEDANDKDADDSVEEMATKLKTKTIPMCRTYTVFNRDQIDGLPKVDSKPVFADLVEAENFVTAQEGLVLKRGPRAAYSITSDAIMMPGKEAFKSKSGYYSTLFHEMIHWTGAKERMDRDMSGRFGDEAYAMEELVAEMGAAFLCAEFGIPSNECQHPEYIASWLKTLKGDKYAIFSAASQAKKAVTFLKEAVEKKEQAA